MSRLIILILCVKLLCLVDFVLSKNTLDLLILHNNDMHARFEETSARSGRCPLLGSNQCYGGFARVAHIVRQARLEAQTGKGPQVLYLNAGDTFTGTAWFTVHRQDMVIEFLNILKPDAASLGNHEFDEGEKGLLPYLERKNFPVVTANIDDPRFKGLQKSVILTVGNYKVGVVGYLTPQTTEISKASDVNITDEIEAINKESQALHAKGIKTIFAVGHSGFEMDKMIAEKCPLIDIVVGGHTNTFLWTGPKPDSEKPEDVYPVVITQPSGKNVPVVQAYAYTKYMGKLLLKIDTDTGKVISFSGSPILVDSKIPQDPDVLQVLEKYRPKVDELDHKIIGRTKVYLEGRDTVCRRQECNTGNLITDAFIDFRAQHYSGHYWTDIAIAIYNSGGIRNSIDTTKRQGDITHADMSGTLPFNNDVVSVILSGDELISVLEHSVHGNGETSGGEFLQFSGIQVIYDRSRNPGDRLVSAKARCAACTIPVFEPIVGSKDYKVLVPSFMSIGGDGYKIIKHARNKTVLSINDYDSVVKYIEKLRVVYPQEEGRIKFIGDDEFRSGAERLVVAKFSLVTVLVCLFNLYR